MQRARPRRRDLQVRCQPPEGVDFLGRERQDGLAGLLLRQAEQDRQEEPRVGHHPLDVGIGRDDGHDGFLAGQTRDVERESRRRQAGELRHGPAQAGTGHRALEERAKGER